ncbi:MAG: holo-ACP synthase [Gammaproteobacteria bacterium]|nr:MAG: holo-ACP synthase [Gammaproteobacteria bacterium]
MIFGIGTDIVQVGRMKKNLERFGDRFPRRILTEQELNEYRNEKKPAHFLARRFAAKEATVKAMGMGFSGGLGWRQIGVNHDARGKPLLEFNGFALEFVEKKGITDSHVSLADEDEYAVAVVALYSA